MFLSLSLGVMNELINVSKTIQNQSHVVHALFLNIAEHKPEMLSGLFYVSNSEAFSIAQEVVTAKLTKINVSWAESLSQAIQDVLRISESLEIEGLDENTLSSLDDLELTIPELLDWITEYDKTAAEWNYSLEDMRRSDFVGIFCMNCDTEIGGELDCPHCPS